MLDVDACALLISAVGVDVRIGNVMRVAVPELPAVAELHEKLADAEPQEPVAHSAW